MFIWEIEKNNILRMAKKDFEYANGYGYGLLKAKAITREQLDEVRRLYWKKTIKAGEEPELDMNKLGWNYQILEGADDPYITKDVEK